MYVRLNSLWSRTEQKHSAWYGFIGFLSRFTRDTRQSSTAHTGLPPPPTPRTTHARMDNQCGAIAFLHVSKTGGMTVEEYIEQETAKRGCETLHPRTPQASLP